MRGVRLQGRPRSGLAALAGERMRVARSVADIAGDMLREAILSGLLEAGQVLRQEELAATLGISRMPIREALRQLESEGLVRHLPRRGFVVANLTARDMSEIHELRVLLEAYAMRLAVPRLDERRLHRLERLHHMMHREGARADALETFYRTLYEAAERPRLLRAIMQLRAEVARYLRAKRTPYASHPHTKLIHILRRRDGRAAQRFMREHLRHIASPLLELVGRARRLEADKTGRAGRK